MRVLIAGCGYVGSALATRLAAAGHDVWGLRRRPDRLPAGVTPVAADLSDPSTLGELPDGLDALVYSAGAGAADPTAYRRAYVQGPRNLLDALGDAPPRVLFTSSTAVYGQRAGEWVDEGSETRPADFRGEILLEAEASLADAAPAAVVLRLAGIYGPGRDRLVRQVAAGEARCGPGPDWTNRIHRDDAAGALGHLLTLRAPESLYLGVDTEPAERCAVLRWLARELGAPEPPVDAGERGGARRPADKRCSGARLRASGYRFRYPSWREGYAELLARRPRAGE